MLQLGALHPEIAALLPAQDAKVTVLHGVPGLPAPVQVFANGNRHEGEWRANLPHGRGTLTTSTGLRYEGDWKDGQRTGQGVFTMRDGTRYSGGFLNGKPEGQGTQVFANGSRYEGMWRNGLPNGPGTGYGAVTGREFRGIFVNGCLRTADTVAAFGVPHEACR